MKAAAFFWASSLVMGLALTVIADSRSAKTKAMNLMCFLYLFLS